MGVAYYYSSTAGIGGFWPYWISAGGLAYRPFWDHYLATGDVGFLRNRVVPGLKELALFYEDYLSATDKDGNYIFAPSISPENTPASTDPVRAAAGQCHHGYRGLPGSAGQFDPGLRRSLAPMPMAWRNGKRCWPKCRPICLSWTAP